jgi:hypothetical protein
MTGILPVLGVGARSTSVGGQSTPSDLASLSLSGSARGSVAVVPCGDGGLVAASIASARNPSHSSRALAGPFEPVASPASAEPERPRWMPSELPRSKEMLLFAMGSKCFRATVVPCWQRNRLAYSLYRPS